MYSSDCIIGQFSVGGCFNDRYQESKIFSVFYVKHIKMFSCTNGINSCGIFCGFEMCANVH